MADEYTVKLNRSPSLEDISTLAAMAEKFARIFGDITTTKGWSELDGEIFALSGGGYIIGAIWFDGETESMRVDFARYGESR